MRTNGTGDGEETPKRGLEGGTPISLRAEVEARDRAIARGGDRPPWKRVLEGGPPAVQCRGDPSLLERIEPCS